MAPILWMDVFDFLPLIYLIRLLSSAFIIIISCLGFGLTRLGGLSECHHIRTSSRDKSSSQRVSKSA